MRDRLRNESGQAILITVVFAVVLIGAAALTTDVGAWYRQQRAAQATADAAALAGAQVLPTDTAQAQTLAEQYGASNGGGVDGVSFSTGFEQNDTVTVKVQRTAPSFFANIFSIDGATVGATASARAGVPNEVDGVAPIVVDKKHPLLSGPGCPCFDVQTSICLGQACTDNPLSGAFGLVDLNGGSKGTPDLADWIESGYDGYLGLGQYEQDPGAKFNSSQIQDALSDRIGTDLLFPVYDGTFGNGGAKSGYNIIGWVAFHLTGFDARGSSGEVDGYFTRAIWNGLQGKTDNDLPDFGVYSVELVN